MERVKRGMSTAKQGEEEERIGPLKHQMMATAVMTRKSSPSRRRPSQSRSWVAKGTEFAKRVMYHFVPYADDEIPLRTCLVERLA